MGTFFHISHVLHKGNIIAYKLVNFAWVVLISGWIRQLSLRIL